MRHRDYAWLGLAVLAGYFCGVVELHTTEVLSTISVIAVTGVLLGFARPRLFWLWALITGGSVPAAYIAAAAFGITPREWPQPPGIISNVAVAAFTMTLAMIATGTGALITHFSPEPN